MADAGAFNMGSATDASTDGARPADRVSTSTAVCGESAEAGQHMGLGLGLGFRVAHARAHNFQQKRRLSTLAGYCDAAWSPVLCQRSMPTAVTVENMVAYRLLELQQWRSHDRAGKGEERQAGQGQY